MGNARRRIWKVPNTSSETRSTKMGTTTTHISVSNSTTKNPHVQRCCQSWLWSKEKRDPKTNKRQTKHSPIHLRNSQSQMLPMPRTQQFNHTRLQKTHTQLFSPHRLIRTPRTSLAKTLQIRFKSHPTPAQQTHARFRG